MGRERYPETDTLMITADGGGSNGSRVKLFKLELQKLADQTGLTLQVFHYPPGTSIPLAHPAGSGALAIHQDPHAREPLASLLQDDRQRFAVYRGGNADLFLASGYPCVTRTRIVKRKPARKPLLIRLLITIEHLISPQVANLCLPFVTPSILPASGQIWACVRCQGGTLEVSVSRRCGRAWQIGSSAFAFGFCLPP